MTERIIKGQHYLSGKPVGIKVAAGMIQEIISDQAQKSSDLPFIAPGLIDIQVNGYNGIDFSAVQLKPDDMVQVTKKLWQKGVTSFFPTLITCTDEVYVHSLTTMRQVTGDKNLKGSIAGIHMEGPYLSAEQGYRGAHNPRWIRNPDWNEFRKYNLLSGNNIAMVTLAPERPGAPEFILKCIENGITVALGHHNAAAETIHHAAEIGAAISTHLGNACANLINRHNNVLWPQLSDDRLTAGMILDGFHLKRDEVIVFYRSKGRDKIILTSDVTKFAGLPPGEYEWYDTKINLSPEGMIRENNQDILAGAAKDLLDDVEIMHYFTGCTIGEAIKMASENPARNLNLSDRGEMSVGKRADFILYRYENDTIELMETIVSGDTVFKIQKDIYNRGENG